MATDPAFPETRTTLLQRVSALDPESWCEFVALYGSLLLAFVGDCDQRYHLSLNSDDREDIRQEVLIKLYHALPTFERCRRFRTWLWRVTHNVVIDWVRAQRGRPKAVRNEAASGNSHRLPRPLEVRITAAVEAQLASDEPAPDALLLQEHQRHMIRYILEKVKEEMQSAHKWDCFERHFLKGQPSAVVAADLGLSVAAVNTNTCRVRARIREWCQHCEVEL